MFGKFTKLSDVKKAESEFQETMENIELEKTDGLAMIIAAFIVFIPVVIIIITLLYSVCWLFFFR